MLTGDTTYTNITWIIIILHHNRQFSVNKKKSISRNDIEFATPAVLLSLEYPNESNPGGVAIIEYIVQVPCS